MTQTTEEAMAAAPATPNPPIAFAIMRNAHEALRKNLFEQLMPLLQNADKDGFQKEWTSFFKAMNYHAMMEDEYVFPMLDEFSGGKIANEMIPLEHVRDAKNIADVNDDINTDGIPKMETFDRWRDHFLNHLSHEEKVMTPMTVTLAPTPGKRATALYEKVIKKLWKKDKENFLFFIGWIVKQLSNFGSTNNNSSTATRVVVHGLQWSTNPTQWKEILQVVKENVSPEIWTEMVQDYHIETPAFQRDVDDIKRISSLKEQKPSRSPKVNNTKHAMVPDTHEDSSLDLSCCSVS